MKRSELPHYLCDMAALESMQVWDVGGATDEQRTRLEAGGFLKDGEITEKGQRAAKAAQSWPTYQRYLQRSESESELDALLE